MKCPLCGGKTEIEDVREVGEGYVRRRRRECKECGKRHWTYESLMVVREEVVMMKVRQVREGEGSKKVKG